MQFVKGQKPEEAGYYSSNTSTSLGVSQERDELIAFANENNIAIDEKATKAVIIEAIEAALK